MLRGGHSQLFIGLQKPHTPVLKGTLARWIKAVLVSSGIDMPMYPIVEDQPEQDTQF